MLLTPNLLTSSLPTSSLPTSSLPTSGLLTPARMSLTHPNRQFKRRSIIPIEQCQTWRILKGFVRTITWEEDGTVVSFGFWAAGDIVGQFCEEMEPFHIECLTSVEAIAFPAQESQIQPWLLEQTKQTQMLLRILNTNSIEKRLTRFLLWLAQRFGHKVAEGWLLHLPLTHQDIAEAIHTTRVTVTRLLGKMEQDQLISWQQKRRLLLLPLEF
jgi:CRP-like cAMP-binding protein